MTNSKIRHIATSYNGDIIATAEFEHKVYIWNLQSGKKICEFQSILDFGGMRLAISEDGTFCAAGAYHIHGIAMYKASNGELIWQRKDLKKIQYLQFGLYHKDTLLAFFDEKPCHILDIRNGNTLKTLRGIRNIKESPFNKIQMLDKSLGLEIFDFEKQQRIAKIPRLTFAILDSVFTEESIVISESGGPVSSYSTNDGKLMWRYAPKEGNHILRLAYCEETNEILGVNWSYEKGGSKTLLSFDKNRGKINRQFLIKNCPAETEFALKGSRLITSGGEVISTTNGKVILNLGFPNDSV